MKISVVIPAYNEEELLPHCLAALTAQAEARTAEIIVVDNNSTDRTADLARQAGCRVIHEPRQGVVYALQRGLQEATGDVVAFTDADTIVDSRWLSTITDEFQNSQVVAITGPVRFSGIPILSWVRWFYRSMLLGSNMAVRRSLGLAVGGFNDQYNLASDIAFGWALGERGEVQYVPKLRVTTSARRFQSQPVRQASRYALNHLWMLFFSRPLFWHFAPIRKSQQELDRQSRRRSWFIGSVMFVAAVIYLSIWPSSSVFGQIVTHGSSGEKDITLTFDDGPNGTATRTIVDILVAHQIPATFFEVGQGVAADPTTARYVATHGMTIGNHSWDHSYRLPYRTPLHIRQELEQTNNAITTTTGQRPLYFRPPHGFRSAQLLFEVHRLNMAVIDWNVDPQDYATTNTEVIYHRVITRIRPGGIILLHDGQQPGLRTVAEQDRRATIAALPRIITTLQQRGYTFVSLGTLLSERTNPDDPR